MSNNSQCCWHLRTEFQRRHVGFKGVHQARFVYFQWRTPLIVILLYRLIVATYCIFWLIYTASYFGTMTMNGVEIPFFAFLTNWTYLILTLYLFWHLLAVVYYICKMGRNPCRIMAPEQHRCLFHELGVEPSLWSSSEYQYVHSADSGDIEDSILGQTTIPVIFRVLWVLYNMAASACLMVTILFWTMLYPQMGPLSGTEFMLNFQLHAVTSIIIVIEQFVTGIPCRLLHFLYPLTYGLIYIVFSGIYYAEDHRHILYPGVLDWSKPGPTVLVVVLTAVIGLPLLQLLLFAVYKLKVFLYDKISPESL